MTRVKMTFELRLVASAVEAQTHKRLVSACWQPGEHITHSTSTAGLVCGFLYKYGTFRLWNAVTNHHWTFKLVSTNSNPTRRTSLMAWSQVRLLAPSVRDAGRRVTAVFVSKELMVPFVAVIPLEGGISTSSSGGSSSSSSGSSDSDVADGAPLGTASTGATSGCLLFAAPTLHTASVTCCEAIYLPSNEFLVATVDGQVLHWAVEEPSSSKIDGQWSLRLRRRWLTGSSHHAVTALAFAEGTVVAATASLQLYCACLPASDCVFSGSSGTNNSNNSADHLVATTATTTASAPDSSTTTLSPRPPVAVDLCSLLPSRHLGTVQCMVAFPASAAGAGPSAAVSDAAVIRRRGNSTTTTTTTNCSTRTGLSVLLGTDAGTVALIPLLEPASYRTLSFPGQAITTVDVDPVRGIAVIGSASGGWMRLCRLATLEVVGYVPVDHVVRCQFTTTPPAATLSWSDAPTTVVNVGASLLLAARDGVIRVWAHDQLPVVDGGENSGVAATCGGAAVDGSGGRGSRGFSCGDESALAKTATTVAVATASAESALANVHTKATSTSRASGSSPSLQHTLRRGVHSTDRFANRLHDAEAHRTTTATTAATAATVGLGAPAVSASREKAAALALAQVLPAQEQVHLRPSSDLATPHIQSRRMVDAELDRVAEKLRLLPSTAGATTLHGDALQQQQHPHQQQQQQHWESDVDSVRRAAANAAVNYTPRSRRYQGLVPLDAATHEFGGSSAIGSSSVYRRPMPASVLASAEVAAATVARTAKALADAMADDEEYAASMTSAGGRAEHAACDRLARQCLVDAEQEASALGLYADGGAMDLLLLAAASWGSS